MSDDHRQLYPEQYSHRLVGRRVSILKGKIRGTVERVVSSGRFGPLVVLKEYGGAKAWLLKDAKEVKS